LPLNPSPCAGAIAASSELSLSWPCSSTGCLHRPKDPMRGWIDRSLGLSIAGLVCLAAVPPAAQTAGGVLEGRAAFGDWHPDRPGLRRIIKPQGLPPPQPSASVTNMSKAAQRTAHN